MTLQELHSWIVSSEGLGSELALLSRFSAVKSISGMATVENDISSFEPDWARLLLAGSVLSMSRDSDAAEAALTVAQASLQLSNQPGVVEAGASVLAQLANHRAIGLAQQRRLLKGNFEGELGITTQMLLARRELEQSIVLTKARAVTANRFQRDFWEGLRDNTWISASAPTASGKTYLVLQWLLNEFAAGKAELAVFLAPTRALVDEIERELLELSPGHGVHRLRVGSLPLAALADRSQPTILVFTQERLHVFLNAVAAVPQFDIAVVDEVHKIGDGPRGVLLQDAIERIARANAALRLVFLSPLTANPELLVEDAPANASRATVPNDTPTVTQNLIVAEQEPLASDVWRLSLRRAGVSMPLGTLKLHARPDSQLKRLSYVALAVGKEDAGTLVYANGAADAERIAAQIFEGLGEPATAPDQELVDLSEFARLTVHPEFQLVDLVRRGVAFHYGNMPTLLRTEIERLFRTGKIRFLVCTSTLVEGVNLACRTIVVRGPKKGKTTPMTPHDFWNLAGRAGRWGQDFTGNVICVDVEQTKLWPQGVPERARYPIKRETDTVLTRREAMLAYLDARTDMPVASIDPALEQVAAYLLSLRAREGTFLSSPSAARLPDDYAVALDASLGRMLEAIDVPSAILAKHPGVSAAALQSLLKYFRGRLGKPVEDLLLSAPESEDAYPRLIAAFKRIDRYVYPAFFPPAAIPVHALVTLAWMRGLPLGQIIKNRINYYAGKGKEENVAKVIRDTMRDVEEVARFRAPKYLAAYLDVLKHHLEHIGKSDLFPPNLKFDLYLEFGVATDTLLALIGLGLSRTSAVTINEYLADDKMTEESTLAWLLERRWTKFDIPAVVKREISEVIMRRQALTA